MESLVFAALVEPPRRAILELLREEERSAGDIVVALGMSQPAVSKHLRVLREAGLASARVDGARRIYRLEPGPLVELNAWVGGFRRYWDDRLDALQRHLDREC